MAEDVLGDSGDVLGGGSGGGGGVALGAAGEAGKALVATDPTTTDARTPKAHQASHHTGGTDPLTPANIGAATTGELAAKAGKAEAGTEATAPTYGRESTIAAPHLRDLVTILDFAEAKHGDGVEDDTAIFKTAMTKLEEVGRSVFVVTPHRKGGGVAFWTVGKSEAGGGEKSVCVRIPSNTTISAYSAKFQALKESGGVEMKWKLFGTTTLNLPTEGITVENVRWFGGSFIGTGKEPEQQGCLGFVRCRDVCVRDLRASKWSKEPTGAGGGVLDFGDNQRCRIESCTMTECSKKGGINVIQVTDSYGGGSNERPYTEVLVTNCIVTGSGASSICVGMGSGSKYSNTTPVRVIIADNIGESSGWAPITVEVGGNPPAEGNFHQINITGNHAKSTSGSYAIDVLVDSTPIIENASTIENVLITDNQCESAAWGIHSMGTGTICEGNIVKAKEKGIYFQAPTNTFLEHMHIRGGSIQVKEGFAVYMNKCKKGSCDTDMSYEAGGSGESAALYLQTCTRIDVESKIYNALGAGIEIESGEGSISILPGTRIYNPSTNGTKPGIEVRGAPSGPIWVLGAHCRDDRGGEAKMKYGLQNLSAETKVFSYRNFYLGWTSAATNGTLAGQKDDTVDETGVLVGKMIWKAVEEVNAKLEASFSTIEYAVENGTVYLRGSMKCKAGEEVAANAVLFKIPVGGRPASTRLVTEPTTEAVRAGKVEASGAVTCLNALKTGISIGFDGVFFVI
jgi:hypothetical protein